jgi:hypothetical protein
MKKRLPKRPKTGLVNRRHRLLPWPLFLRRMATVGLIMLCALGIALLIGITGYRYIVGLSWIDALLNASMILTGMGPVAPMTTNGAKLFASAYAIFSGVVFLSSIGVLLSPILLRFLHHFHIQEND